LATGDGALKFDPSELAEEEGVFGGGDGDAVNLGSSDFRDIPFGEGTGVEEIVIYH